MRRALSLLPLLLILSSCGNGISNSSSDVGENLTSEEVPKVEITSANGKAKITVFNAALTESDSRTEYQQTVLIPHVGTTMKIDVEDVDNDKVYIYGFYTEDALICSNSASSDSCSYMEVSGGVSIGNILNNEKFVLSTDNGAYTEKVTATATDGSAFSEEDMIVVPLTNGQGSLIFDFLSPVCGACGRIWEGRSTGITLKLYNLITQGENKVLDLGDYFNPFTIKINALPRISFGGETCSASSTKTYLAEVGDVYTVTIPPDSQCLTFKFQNQDGEGFNPAYSYDGLAYEDIDYSLQITKNFTLSQGENTTVTVGVKESLDEGGNIWDSGTYILKIYRDSFNPDSPKVTVKCRDLSTGAIWNAVNWGSCPFGDPQDATTDAGSITITGSTSVEGTCTVRLYKGDTLVSENTSQTCSNINVTYTVKGDEAGSGVVPLTVKVFKNYSNGTETVEKQIDQFTVGYAVNQSPDFLNSELFVKVWEYQTGSWVDSSPAIADLNGDGKLDVVIGSLDNKVYALNGENGQLLWSFQTGDDVYSSPAIADLNGDGKPDVVIGSLDNKVYALNGENGQLLWSFQTGGDVDSSPAIADINGDGKPDVVIGSDDYKVYALNGENGQLLWSFYTGDIVHSSPAIADINGDGKLDVVIGSKSGKIYAINGENGQLLWEFLAGCYVHSSPAIADINGDGKLDVVVGRSVCGWDSSIVALNGENGQLLWNFPINNNWTFSSPAIADINGDGKLDVVIGSKSGKIYAINGENGQLLWSFQTENWVDSSPAIADINGDGKLDVVIGSKSGKIYAINGENGQLLWSFQTENWVDSSPAIADINGDGKLDVVIGSFDNKVYALNGENGQLLWSFQTGSSIYSSPVIGDVDRNGLLDIIVGSGDGKIYRFEATRPHGKVVWSKFRGDLRNTGYYPSALNYSKEQIFDW
ncbi:FG-GAP-like repeat-containing protein [Phorcysia thermohydrogeniphila]|uniref:Outer membrane protein assembly factor BamB n=1 Tax=Phorcysia thermohydrogeniphila TaxID=936138 RepID=A0A4R1GDU6_9BACT|nr:FG-GAP-like repeat-containing protein [Phorcysia thermohydrogeniphila]TCK06284.1 outer membrane protein assembly factor BamB [Phorcysia thermohydrogeniphila]